MPASRRRGVRALLGACAVLLLAGSAAPAAMGQIPRPDSEQAPLIDQAQAADPTATVPETAPPDGTEPKVPADGGDDAAPDRGYANAAMQAAPAKRQEAMGDCQGNPPPISRMLGVGGFVAGDEGVPWDLLVLVLGAGALLFALSAYAIRRRRRARDESSRMALVTVPALLGALVSVAGLALQFVPGLAIDETPPPEADMTVRAVHVRITRGEYAEKTGAARFLELSSEDRREVGNVIWLEIELRGYGGKRPALQYGLYDRGATNRGALLPRTEKRVTLRVEDKDIQTTFLPVWVGYPKSERFQVQFRLLEGEQVRELASTGDLKGSEYRYACIGRR